ncbi:ammonium transporter [Pedobacter sp. SYSU D00535]|uniref:ammonium transporter n=1 Tax=Pedobacter sp. SYSU D00535 TaxID=2810308 RepID=UPI001A97B052|nr:ammonium transporter [Pedobacter sp. SYSU D00535]
MEILTSVFEISGNLPTAAILAAVEEGGAAAEIANAMLTSNNIWMMLSTALVFIMHLGFASVEAGFAQTKNTVNILFKNTITPVIGILIYALVGFGLMYPGFEAGSHSWFGFSGFGLTAPENGNTADYANGGYTYWTDFLFQAMFAATCATIVSGAVAERIKFGAYMTFTLIFVGLVYPIAGSWKWGYGALNDMGFHDFAGSTLVHSVGGWAALAGIILLGARKGKYVNGQVRSFAASNLPLATAGTFLLFLGWFGFNGGSVLSADPGLTSLVLVNTTLGGCAGAVAAVLLAYFVNKTYDFGMALNGILAGLVGITAGADVITPAESIIIGLVAGFIVVLAVKLLDALKLDDVVGAVPVHLFCGVWGTLAVGIWGEGKDFMVQLQGVAIYGAVSFIAAFVIFAALKYTVGIRVSENEEVEGLDKYEHGIDAYSIPAVLTLETAEAKSAGKVEEEAFV